MFEITWTVVEETTHRTTVSADDLARMIQVGSGDFELKLAAAEGDPNMVYGPRPLADGLAEIDGQDTEEGVAVFERRHIVIKPV